MNGAGGLGRWVLAAHLAGGVLVIVCATVLGALHDLDPQAVVAIYGTAVGLLGGSAAAVGAVGASINGKALVPPETVEHALTSLASSTPAATGGEQHG